MESSTATNSSFPAKLTIKDFAVQAEMVAVETSIDVGIYNSTVAFDNINDLILQCRGNETHISQCLTNTDCGSTEYASVFCFPESTVISEGNFTVIHLYLVHFYGTYIFGCEISIVIIAAIQRLLLINLILL